MTTLNALSAEEVANEHFRAAAASLEAATNAANGLLVERPTVDRHVAIANVHVKLAELAMQFRPGR